MDVVSEGFSCPLCLKADEPASMVAVAITHHAMDQGATVRLCRRCAGAVSRAYSTGEIEVDQGAPAGIPAAAAPAAGELDQEKPDGNSEE